MPRPQETNQTLLDKTNARRSSSKKKPANTWKGFIECELNEEDKHVLKTSPQFDATNLMDILSRIVYGHYKLSLSFDAKNHTAIASMTDNDPESDTQGFTLTGRGKSPEHALHALLYKHFWKLKDGWETPSETDTEYG